MSEHPAPDSRSAISRAKFFLAKAQESPLTERQEYEAYLDAAIIFARSALHRVHKQFGSYPWFKAVWDSLLNDDAVNFFRLHRDRVLKEAPIKVGQRIVMGAVENKADALYFFEPDKAASETVAKHIARIAAIVDRCHQCEHPIGLYGGINPFDYVSQDPLWGSDTMGLQSDICRGPDCINPPYDPTPDGPKPSPNKAPKKDPAYEGWMDKCVEEFCAGIKGDGFGSWCRRKGCEITTKWACRRAGTNFNCCDCVKHQCINSMAGKGMDEHAAYAYCQSNFLLCMGRGK